jgi:hypothetical protein
VIPLSQNSLVSISAQLLELLDPSLKLNVELKIKSNASVMRQCMEIETGVTEGVNQKQEEVTHAKNGQVKVLIDIQEKYIQIMVLMEVTTSAETQMVNILFGAIQPTLEGAGIFVILFQETRMPVHG